MRFFGGSQRFVRVLVATAGIALCAQGLASASVPERTVELVSDNDKAVPVIGAVLSRDGERVLYRVSGGTPDTSYGRTGVMLARRASTGWGTTNAFPAREEMGTGDATVISAASDLRRLSILASPELGTQGTSTLIRYSPESGELVRGSTWPPPGAPEMVTSDDQLRVVGPSIAPLVPEDTAPNGGLYEFGSGQPVLIGLLPGDVPPRCGVGRGGFMITSNADAGQHWLSADGNRVIFHSAGNGDCSSDPMNVYMREGGGTGFTRLISGPPIEGPDLGARFLRATADGSEVFYTTATRIDPRDRNDSRDVYRYSVSGTNSCLTCAVPDAQVMTPGPPPDNAWETVLAAETGDRVYFTSPAVLADGARAGDANLYVWRKASPDAIHFVAPADPMRTSTTTVSATANPDGAVMVFMSDNQALNALTETDNGGTNQFYRYDDVSGTLDCVSCPSGRAATNPVQAFGALGIFIFSSVRVFSNDGRSLVFVTRESLVPWDGNEARDIYEWRDNGVALITDGKSSQVSHTLYEISADGRDVLFSSTNDLAPGVVEHSRQLYDARIGGGFPSREERQPCQDDQCQGSPPAPPVLPKPDSIGLLTPPTLEDEFPRARRPQRSVRTVTRTTRRARVVIVARAPAAGMLTVSGRQIRAARRRVSRAGSYRIAVRLTRAARRELRARGRLRIRVRVAYAPSSR